MIEDAWQELLTQALTGDTDAFAELFEGYLRKKLVRYAYSILKDAHEAEDVVQEIFLRLFEGRKYSNVRKKHLNSFTWFLLKTVQHDCLDRVRRRTSSRFFLTDAVLEHLRHEGISQEVLHTLAQIRQKKSQGEDGFMSLIIAAIGKDRLSVRLKELLLRYSRECHTPLSDYISRIAHAQPVSSLEQERLTGELCALIQENLSAAEWDLLYQKYALGMTYKEISIQQDAPITTLRSRCKRLVDTLSTDERILALWQAFLEAQQGE